MLVAVLSENTIIIRTASFSGNVAPSEKCSEDAATRHLVVLLQSEFRVELHLLVLTCQYVSTITGNLMRLAVGIAVSAFR